MNLKGAVLATLSYHSIFSYPLTREETNNYLISTSSKQKSTNSAISSLIQSGKIIELQGFIALKTDRKLIKLRKSRLLYSKYKNLRAKTYAKILKSIPSVKLIAITGALAMENSTKSDDIDFLIVTSAGKLWTTRFFANLLLSPFKRSPGSKKQKDKACLNIFLDESNLKITDQNLYTAHEIAQMKPLYNVNNTYQKLIKVNSWVHDYLPNWKLENTEGLKAKQKRDSKKALVFNRLSSVARTFEALARWGQWNYMKSKVTSETIGDTQLFFHPTTTRDKVIQIYKSKLIAIDKKAYSEYYSLSC